MQAERLQFVDATLALIDAALEGDARLGEALAASIAHDWSVFPDALPALREMVLARREPHPWGTLLLVLREPRTLVGMGGYKGPPNAAGVVELGYAIAPAHRSQGLASEAARWMVERAFDDPRVLAVDAHTLGKESHSTRILSRLGLVRMGEVVDPDEGPLWHWRRLRAGQSPLPAPR